MTCRYVYSRTEYFRAVNLLARREARWTLIFLGMLALCFVWLASWSSMPSTDVDIVLSHFGPPVLLIAILVSPPGIGYLNYWAAFRQSWFEGKLLILNFSEEGLQLESDAFNQVNSWEFVGKVREDRNGFLLMWGNSSIQFHWVPKSGFDAMDDVDAFRELLTRHVAQFRRSR